MDGYGDKQNMRIGILTFHRSINYGAFLQAYALLKALSSATNKSTVVEIIDYSSKKAEENYKQIYKSKSNSIDIQRFIQFLKFRQSIFRMHRSKAHLISDDLATFRSFVKNQNYDLIIVGSDEVWKIDGMRGFPNAFWLKDITWNVKKVSYAASSRNEFEKLSEKEKTYMRSSLEGFSYIGSRDGYTKILVDRLCGKGISEHNCDPVFLWDFTKCGDEYAKRLRKKYPVFKKKKIMVVMIPDDRLCNLIKIKMGDEYLIVSVMDRNDSADLNILDLSPFEWIGIIRCADCIITNRFHGCAFSILFSKPFLALDDYDDQKTSKIADLLDRFRMTKNYYYYQHIKIPKIRHEVVDLLKAISKEKPNNLELIKKEVSNSDGFFRYIKNLERAVKC